MHARRDATLSHPTPKAENPLSRSEPLVVCLGYPGLQQPRFIERLEAIDPRIEVVTLPIDEGADWGNDTSHLPHDEPPPWGEQCADARREALARCEAMVALNAPKAMMEVAPKLRWVQGLGAGVEQFAKAGVQRDRCVVTNASGVSAPSMSEWVIGRLLQVWKRFPEAEAHQRNHEYVRTYGKSFAGSTIGIVGMGAIGCEVARRLRVFRCTVLGSKRDPKSGDAVELADELYASTDLLEMLPRCDAVVVAAPATPETHHLFDRETIGAMKSGAMLINVARGSLVDSEALVEALESGHLGWAALDVFEEEPLPSSSPLWDVPNLLTSAHSSASVDRYMDDIFDLFEANLRRYVAGEPLENQVDMKALGFP